MRTEFKIKEHYPSGFDISIGVGRLFWAKDLKEVGISLEHYFNHIFCKHTEKGFDVKKCPLCRG